MRRKLSYILLLAVVLFAFVPAMKAQTWNGVTGFATYSDLGVSGITGGGAGEVVHVSTYADLKKYVGSAEPYVIIVDNEIQGGGMNDREDIISLNSNKTIIGAGAGAMLNGINLDAKGKNNIIIRNIKLRKGRTDGMSFRSCHHVWVDHCDLSESYDGLLDFTVGSDYLTVTWTKLHDHDKTSTTNSGTGHFEDYNKEHVTMAHCMFSNNTQRNPRIGYGKMHIYNCYWEDIDSYCIGFHSQAEVLSENNHFSATANNPFCNQYSDKLPYRGYLTDKGSYFAKGTPSKNYQYTYTDISYSPLTYYNYDFDLHATNDVVTTTPKGVGPQEGIQYEPILCPGNGAIDVSVTQTLSWGKVDGATAMKMYFGTSVDNMTETTPEAVKLQPATTYFWKVVAIVGGKEYASPVYRFTTAGEKASKPYPTEGMKLPWLRWPVQGDKFCVAMPLTWRPAADAAKYKVYLSADEASLDNSFIGETSSLTLTPGSLKVGTTYYWRVDAVKADGSVVKGDKWTFSSTKKNWVAGKNESEKMYVSGIAFRESNSAASGSYNTVGDQGPGAVLATWGGAEGRYAIETYAFNQTLGPNLYGISVNDKLVDMWYSSDQNDNLDVRKTRNTLYLKPGDEIRIDFVAGLVKGTEYKSRARIDYVTFSATDKEVIEVARPSKAYHEPVSTPGYDCEYLRLANTVFVDTLGTLGDKGLTQVKDEYCTWVELKDNGYMLYVKQTAMVKAVYVDGNGKQTELTTEYDKTKSHDVMLATTTDAGTLYAVKLYKNLPTKTSYYQPVADNGVDYQVILSPDVVFLDSKGTKGDAGKVQVRDAYEEWTKYTNPSSNEVHGKENSPAFIDPLTDKAISGKIITGKDGCQYSYVVGTAKYMEYYLQGCKRMKFYYTGTGGAATNVSITVADNTSETFETMTGNEAPGKNVVSNTYEFTLDPSHKYVVKIAGSTGDMLVYAIRLWPGETTGIENVNDSDADNAPVYNVAGQRVTESAKGVLIRNGRKVVIK